MKYAEVLIMRPLNNSAACPFRNLARIAGIICAKLMINLVTLCVVIPCVVLVHTSILQEL